MPFFNVFKGLHCQLFLTASLNTKDYLRRCQPATIPSQIWLAIFTSKLPAMMSALRRWIQSVDVARWTTRSR